MRAATSRRVLVNTFDRIKKNPTSARSIVDVAVIEQVRKLLKDADIQALQHQGAILHDIGTFLINHRSTNDQTSQFPEAYGLLFNRLDFLRTLASLHTAGEQETSPGPGRIDAFGNVRRLVFNKAPKVSLNAPVSFPHLWGVNQVEWFHWDGNTNSFMERNIGQAMGLGAIAVLETGASTISPLNIHTLESLFSQRYAPHTGPRKNSARLIPHRGNTAEGQRCTCTIARSATIDTRGARGVRTVPITYALDVDRDRSASRHELRESARGWEAVHSRAAGDSGKGQESCRDRGESGEHRGQLDLPEDQIRWLTTLGYVARPLEGIWATAPYLHNGSVPTLDDLLKPEAERPVCFPSGTPRVRPRQARATSPSYPQGARGGTIACRHV